MTAFFFHFSALTLARVADPIFSGIWTSVFYILEGGIAVRCARLDISSPSRGKLLACIILNSLVAALSTATVIFLIVYWSSLNLDYAYIFRNRYGDGDGMSYSTRHTSNLVADWVSYYSGSVLYKKASLTVSIINLLAAIPLSITAAVLATKIRKAAKPVTVTTVAPSAPPIVGPVVSSGYSVVPLMPPSYHSYDTTTQHAGPGYVIHVDVAK